MNFVISPLPAKASKVVFLQRLSWFFFLFLLSATGFAEPQHITLFSRISLSPSVLEILRQALTTQVKNPVLLSVKSFASPLKLEDLPHGSFILTEQPINSSPGHSCRFSGFEFPLIWVLAVREPALKKMDMPFPETISDFFDCLQKLKEHNPEQFPWFESLLEPFTLLRLNQGIESAPIRTLLKSAFDEKLLNPLSLEADESLAFEVFAAGDSVFTSMWIPEQLLDQTASNPSDLKQAVFIPFPGNTKPTMVYRTRLSLFHLGESIPPANASAPPLTSAPNEYPIVHNPQKRLPRWTDIKITDGNPAQENEWMDKTFSDQYNQLIQSTP